MVTSSIVRLLLASYSDRRERSNWKTQNRIGIMKFGSISNKTVLLIAALAVGIVGERVTTIALTDTAAPVGPKLTPKLKQLLKTEIEPPRVCRRLICLSYAAISDLSIAA
jgi:hypothetical protein